MLTPTLRRVARHRQGVWLGPISQAGATLELATIVASSFPIGARVCTLIIALTGLHVRICPILFKAALQRAGEVPAIADGSDRA